MLSPMLFGVVEIGIVCVASPASLLLVIMFGEKIHASARREGSTDAILITYP